MTAPTDMTSIPPRLSVTDLADIVGVSAQTVLRWIASGKVPSSFVTRAKSRGRQGWRYEIDATALAIFAAENAVVTEEVATAGTTENAGATKEIVADGTTENAGATERSAMAGTTGGTTRCAHCVERINPTRTCVAYLIGAESCSCWEHHGSCTCGAATGTPNA